MTLDFPRIIILINKFYIRMNGLSSIQGLEIEYGLVWTCVEVCKRLPSSQLRRCIITVVCLYVVVIQLRSSSCCLANSAPIFHSHEELSCRKFLPLIRRVVNRGNFMPITGSSVTTISLTRTWR